jgi:hypothetical protein
LDLLTLADIDRPRGAWHAVLAKFFRERVQLTFLAVDQANSGPTASKQPT